MSDIMAMKPGLRFLNNVGNFAFYDNRVNQVAFTGSFATSYAIEITGTNTDTRAGRGNPLIYRSFSDRNVAITLTLQEFNLEYIAATVGSDIDYGLAELFVIERSIPVDGNGIATLDELATGSVSVRLPDRSRVEVPATPENTIDLSAFGLNEGDCVSVTYMYMGDAKSVTISADQMPRIGRLVMEGVLSDSRVGEVGKLIVDIPSFSLDGSLSITMNADGSTSQSAIAGTALAVDGTACGEGSVYGYAREVISGETPRIVDLIASPSPIELEALPSPTTQLISVIGSRGVMYSEVGISNTECAFVSDTPAVATVDANGLVTAVSAGSAIITITHTASGLVDTVDVEVEG